MADIVLKLDESHDGKTKEQILEVIEQELNKFSKFMETGVEWKARGGLTTRERFLLKTYLVHKFAGRLDGGT